MQVLAMSMLNRIVFENAPQVSSNRDASVGTVVLNGSESWSADRKRRAVQASAGRIAAQLEHFEESVRLLSTLEAPLLWHELATAGYALLKLGRAEEAIT
jgi:hypothetical protein